MYTASRVEWWFACFHPMPIATSNTNASIMFIVLSSVMQRSASFYKHTPTPIFRMGGQLLVDWINESVTSYVYFHTIRMLPPKRCQYLIFGQELMQSTRCNFIASRAEHVPIIFRNLVEDWLVPFCASCKPIKQIAADNCRNNRCEWSQFLRGCCQIPWRTSNMMFWNEFQLKNVVASAIVLNRMKFEWRHSHKTLIYCMRCMECRHVMAVFIVFVRLLFYCDVALDNCTSREIYFYVDSYFQLDESFQKKHICANHTADLLIDAVHRAYH